MYRILLVEDDYTLAEAIKKQLESWGNEVAVIRDFRSVTAEFDDEKPHLVLMDIMLPFFSGFHWCGEIRKKSNVPVIFISSASDRMNIVMAINMGGDDFLEKPVDPMVLTAKVQAVLRRTYEMSDVMPVLSCGGAELDLNSATVKHGGRSAELTKNEFRILRTLFENKGKIVSRDTLMLKLWQDDCYVEENTLTVNVARLRKKMEGIGLGDLIVTKTGSGYIVK